MILTSFDEYQVFKRQTRLSINLEKRHCSCGKRTLTWIPYRNVISCMAHWRVDLKEYCISSVKFKLLGGLIVR